MSPAVRRPAIPARIGALSKSVHPYQPSAADQRAAARAATPQALRELAQLPNRGRKTACAEDSSLFDRVSEQFNPNEAAYGLPRD